jgi:Uma2 family endonuclease
LVVICGEPQYHDDHKDVVVNPSVIIEVLSESTEARDRGVKFHRYQTWSPSLTDYILVWQLAPIIERYVRQADGSWTYHVYTGLGQCLSIDSINCALRLSDVYDRIAFPEEAEDYLVEA